MINQTIFKTETPLSKARAIWWLHPSAIVCVFLIPAYLFFWWAGLETRGAVSTAKSLFFLKGDIALLGLLGLLALALGTFSPIRPSPPQTITRRTFVSPNVLSILGTLALVGYIFWFKDLILHPATLVAALKSKGSLTYALRTASDRSAGIGSLAQLGLPFLVMYSHAWWGGGRSVIQSIHRKLLPCILLAITFRVFAWGERVALIEAAIAVGFVWVSFADFKHSRGRRLLAWLPLFGVVGVVLLFALGEYFRSWSSHYVNTHTSFWGFILQRLTNYYFTALNTGAGILTMYEWPTYNFEATLRWLHKFPIIGGIFSYLVHFKHNSFLELYGDPEFNNPSGLFSIFSDLGIAGGLSLLLLIGATSKYVYAIWRNSSTLPGVLYFLFLMTFMELFRYYYLGDSRCFMVILGFTLALLNNVKVNYEHSVPSQIPGGLSGRSPVTA